MIELKHDYTIVVVTHNMQQAARVSDRTAFFTVDVSDGDTHRDAGRDGPDRADLHGPRSAHRRLHRRLRVGPFRLSARPLELESSLAGGAPVIAKIDPAGRCPPAWSVRRS